MKLPPFIYVVNTNLSGWCQLLRRNDEAINELIIICWKYRWQRGTKGLHLNLNYLQFIRRKEETEDIVWNEFKLDCFCLSLKWLDACLPVLTFKFLSIAVTSVKVILCPYPDSDNVLRLLFHIFTIRCR